MCVFLPQRDDSARNVGRASFDLTTNAPAIASVAKGTRLTFIYTIRFQQSHAHTKVIKVIRPLSRPFTRTLAPAAHTQARNPGRSFGVGTRNRSRDIRSICQADIYLPDRGGHRLDTSNRAMQIGLIITIWLGVRRSAEFCWFSSCKECLRSSFPDNRVILLFARARGTLSSSNKRSLLVL